MESKELSGNSSQPNLSDQNQWQNMQVAKRFKKRIDGMMDEVGDLISDLLQTRDECERIAIEMKALQTQFRRNRMYRVPKQ